MNKDFHFLCIVHCVHVDFFNVFTVGEGSLILTCAKFWKKVPSLQKKKKKKMMPGWTLNGNQLNFNKSRIYEISDRIEGARGSLVNGKWKLQDVWKWTISKSIFSIQAWWRAAACEGWNWHFRVARRRVGSDPFPVPAMNNGGCLSKFLKYTTAAYWLRHGDIIFIHVARANFSQ